MSLDMTLNFVMNRRVSITVPTDFFLSRNILRALFLRMVVIRKQLPAEFLMCC